MSRPALATWLAAAAVAAFPTWEEWRYRLDPGPLEGFSCIGGWAETSPLDPLRGDLDMLLMDVEAWAIAPLLILGALLARRDPRRAGRRTAAVLVLIAVVEPATPLYSSEDGCGTIPILSAEWFATVMDSWVSTQYCLIAAAALVLLATWRADGAPSPSAGLVWHRAVAVLVDYVALLALLTFVVGPMLWLPGWMSLNLDYGLLNRATIKLDCVDLEGLVVLSVVFLYFWGQHALWGQTLGKRLLGLEVSATRTALRTLIFPLLVFVPFAGPVILIANGMWTLLDPEGRALHDRLLNTEVTRKARTEVSA
ncbi:RDD family protein [Herbidospora cretacea]|uniref:RDD family protein n=1 Tax=Herbidospora cretacea TaxID=28444 RepID=UPI0004C3B30C|nr:RDD family protein [Herbidospora cretacea]